MKRRANRPKRVLIAGSDQYPRIEQDIDGYLAANGAGEIVTVGHGQVARYAYEAARVRGLARSCFGHDGDQRGVTNVVERMCIDAVLYADEVVILWAREGWGVRLLLDACISHNMRWTMLRPDGKIEIHQGDRLIGVAMPPPVPS